MCSQLVYRRLFSFSVDEDDDYICRVGQLRTFRFNKNFKKPLITGG